MATHPSGTMGPCARRHFNDRSPGLRPTTDFLPVVGPAGGRVTRTDLSLEELRADDDVAQALAALSRLGLSQPTSSVRATLTVLPRRVVPRPVAPEELRPLIEHTLLSPTAMAADIDRICDEALQHRLGGVCVNPVWVRRAAERLRGSAARLVTVVSFPLGATTTGIKVAEAAAAVADGAVEVDMVANLGALREGDFRAFHDDVHAVVEATGDAMVKVIIEAGILERREKVIATLLAAAAGAQFVKTSTGYAYASTAEGYVPLGATVEDVSFLRSVAPEHVGVKASGGIRTTEQAIALVTAGATRLGTSASLRILGED